MAFQPVQFPISAPTIIQPHVIQQQQAQYPGMLTSIGRGLSAGISQGLGELVKDSIAGDPQADTAEENIAASQQKRRAEAVHYAAQLKADPRPEAQAAYQAYIAQNKDLLGEQADTLVYEQEANKKAQAMGMEDQMIGTPTSVPYKELTPEQQTLYQQQMMKIRNQGQMLQQYRLDQMPTPDQTFMANSTMQQAGDLHTAMFIAKTGGMDSATIAGLGDIGLISKMVEAQRKSASMDLNERQQGAIELNDAVQAATKLYSPFTAQAMIKSSQEHLAQGLGVAAKLTLNKKMEEEIKSLGVGTTIAAESHDHAKTLWDYDRRFKDAQLEQIALTNKGLGLQQDVFRLTKDATVRQAIAQADIMQADAKTRPAEKAVALASSWSAIKMQQVMADMRYDENVLNLAKTQFAMQSQQAQQAQQMMATSFQMLAGLAKFKQEVNQSQLQLIALGNSAGTETQRAALADQVLEGQRVISAYQTGLKNMSEKLGTMNPIDRDSFIKLYDAAKVQLGPSANILNAFNPGTGQINDDGLKSPISGEYMDPLIFKLVTSTHTSLPNATPESLRNEKVQGVPLPQFVEKQGYKWDYFLRMMGFGTTARK